MTARMKGMDVVYEKVGVEEPMWRSGSFILALDKLAKLASRRGFTPKEAGAALRWHMEAMERQDETDDDAG